MSEFVRWLAVCELLGLTFLPLTAWLLSRLPDRGYSFSKVVGLVGVTYLAWIVGSVFPRVGSPLAPWIVLVAAGVACWGALGSQTVADLRPLGRTIVIQEALFVGALAVWSLLRAQVFMPDISHTEQYMDLSLLQASLRSGSYPPFDPWMSGHTINYYYFGYLTFATLTKMSGAAATVGYNLSLSFIFAAVVSGAYSLGLALTRSAAWAFLAPLAVTLVGNWHAVLVQIPAQQFPSNTTWWFFASTRVVDGSNTINEFPLFSLILGDLHPHVMALPIVLLAIALAANLLFSPLLDQSTRTAVFWFRLAVTAVPIGLLYATNSWDFPTYLLLAVAGAFAAAFVGDDTRSWWRPPLLHSVGLGGLAVLLCAPFYLRFHSQFHGLGRVYSRTDPGQFIQVFGIFFVPCLFLLGGLAYLLRPIDADFSGEEDEVERFRSWPSAEIGQIDGNMVFLATVSIGAIVIGAIYHLWVLLFVVGVGLVCLNLLQRVLLTDEPNRQDALALLLIGVACVVLASTELFYFRDAFDGGALYRMNTIFKFYYQAWVLLALATAYAVFRACGIARSLFNRTAAAAVLVVAAACLVGGGVYTRYALAAPVGATTSPRDLDGMGWLAAAHPSDYLAIRWLQSHVSGNPVELEAERDQPPGQQPASDYDAAVSRVSAFTGLPTVIGWPGHEDQWRPGDAQVGSRVNDVSTIYTTTNERLARSLLRKYHVRFVFVGDTERDTYGHNPTSLAKFAHFMRLVFRAGDTRIYTW